MPAASCYLFRNLSGEKMAVIEAISTTETRPQGQWLFHKAEKAEHIYMVEDGAIELVMPVDPDIEVPVALIRPGNGCVGVGALVERQPFGGFKMSGVGSKAGGPDYLLQFVEPRVTTENTMRRGFAPPDELVEDL